ncbi:MAG: hypothetical protein J6Q21_01960 [Alistipes sp.]|nr:hypothetical protein [Alistipes sp.]
MKKSVDIEYVAPEMEIVSTVVEAGFEGSADGLNAGIGEVEEDMGGEFFWF